MQYRQAIEGIACRKYDILSSSFKNACNFNMSIRMHIWCKSNSTVLMPHSVGAASVHQLQLLQMCYKFPQ